MTVRLADLPPAVRQRVEQETGTGRPPKDRRGVGGVGDGQPCPYRCHDCGHREPSWSKLERHLASAGHHRGDVVLEELGR